MGQLFPASKQLAQAHNDWTKVNRDIDPLLLWQIITTTHIVAPTGNPAMDKRAALLAFNTIERRNGDITRLLAEEQVFQFIVGMRGKYSACSQHIQIDMIERVATPATIAEAEMRQSMGDKKYLALIRKETKAICEWGHMSLPQKCDR